MFEPLSTAKTVWQAYGVAGLVGISVALVLTVVAQGVKRRRFYHNLPGPPHDWIWGHLKIMGDLTKLVPADAHPQHMFTLLQRRYNLPGLFYLDLWPFARSMVIVTDAPVAYQITQKRVLPHHEWEDEYVHAVTGGGGFFTVESKEWKLHRSLMSPAYAPRNLLGVYPKVVEQVRNFRGVLERLATTESVFRMEEMAARFSFDAVGLFLLDREFNVQTDDKGPGRQAYDALRDAMRIQTPVNLTLYERVAQRWLVQSRRAVLHRLVAPVVQHRIASTGDIKEKRQSHFETVLDTELRMAEKKGNLNEVSRGILADIKTLFIGGIDTSASALAWVYFFLSVYPDVLRRMREEHDAKIPGPREGALEQLAQNPSLLNELEYTAAVIKETLRLRPGGSVVRMVEKGMMIEDQGNEYAAWDHPIMINAHGIQRRPEYFHDPDAFDPDRWLTASPDPANAWRPFERGAHSCLGQEFATMNSKTALVATVRMFDFETKYSADALSWPDPAVGGKEVDGKAYQELTFSAKPKGGLPMVVSLRR